MSRVVSDHFHPDFGGRAAGEVRADDDSLRSSSDCRRQLFPEHRGRSEKRQAKELMCPLSCSINCQFYKPLNRVCKTRQVKRK